MKTVIQVLAHLVKARKVKETAASKKILKIEFSNFHLIFLSWIDK